jgi:hypothetical protein
MVVVIHSVMNEVPEVAERAVVVPGPAKTSSPPDRPRPPAPA